MDCIGPHIQSIQSIDITDVWRIDNKDGKETWLCQDCHRRKDHLNHLYRAGDQTIGGATHLKNIHGRIKEVLVANMRPSQVSD